MTARGFRGGPETTTVMGDLYVVLMARTLDAVAGSERCVSALHRRAKAAAVLPTIEFEGLRALHIEGGLAPANTDEGPGTGMPYLKAAFMSKYGSFRRWVIR